MVLPYGLLFALALNSPFRGQPAAPRLSDCASLWSWVERPPLVKTGEELSRATELVKAAARCGDDRALALELAGRALELAPNEPAVEESYIDQLLALNLRAEAAQRLDALLAEEPTGLGSARFLRAQLALEDGEFDRANTLLAPLREDPIYGDAASALSRELQAQQEVELSTDSDPDEGHPTVWSSRAELHLGARRSFNTRRIAAGRVYRLLINARCEPKKSSRTRRRSRTPNPSPESFGIDFRVQVGNLPPMPLDVGIEGTVQNRIPFRPLEDDPQIQVEDHTDAKVNVRCVLNELAVQVL
jgi:hypothetical protein